MDVVFLFAMVIGFLLIGVPIAVSLGLSSIIFLMDRKGRYVTHFTHQMPPEKMAAVIREHL